MRLILFQDHTEPTEGRRSSKYDIYGTATKPFGEGYRRSLVVQDSEDSPLDTDSVDGTTMGCSTSRTQVGDDGPTKGTFSSDPRTAPSASSDKRGGKVTGQDDKKVLTNNEYNKEASKKLSDFEIIYGVDQKNNNSNITTDIYSEVKKPEKETNQKVQKADKTPRENLLKEIRERREENGDNEKCVQNSSVVNETNEKESLKLATHTEETERFNKETNTIDEVDKSNCKAVEPVSFIEEEYSYEPGNDETTSKLVVRSRSLVNLEDNNSDSNNGSTVRRPNAMKITTKPDGTIRYGLRQSSKDTNVDDSDDSPIPESEIKNNYVSSIKNAFDAAIEIQNKDKTGKAEAFDGLRQYFHDNKHGLQDLLINNNVVIIEPFRHEPPNGLSDKTDSSSQRTCRITGATIKSPVTEQNKINAPFNTLPRRNTKSQQNVRQGFYHPIKNNKEIIDTELPDPEKVKSAREWFEQIFKSKSSSELPSKKSPTSFFNTISGRSRITAEVKVIQEGRHVCNEKKKTGRYTIDQAMREDLKRYPHHRRWTDTGSLSSGVSSDFSCDQDCEFHHHDCSTGGSHQEILEEYSTEEEDVEYYYPYDDDEIHPVSTEVLQKIRACGTTVTYYGGKVISRSHGQLRSPMTMSIMDEIRQGGGASEGRKKFESESEEPYLGVKFRLVKSHSCGSRLEIAGTEEDGSHKLLSPRHESFRGESIAEETTDVKEVQDTKNEAEENHTSIEEEEDKAEADRYVTNVEVDATIKSPQTMTWAELKLKEARKQWHCAPEAVRVPSQDMEFETFEVLDESRPRKTECNEAGRG